MDLYNRDNPRVTIGQADEIWYRLSARYADAAEGEVTAFVHDPRPTSAWLTRELGALKKNPAVTKIKVFDPVTEIVTYP